MNYYYRYLGDYAKDTMYLTALQNGVYNFLLDRYYADEKPIPADEVYQTCRANTKEERAAVNKILERFFTKRDNSWVNAKCEKEIAKARHRINVARQNGAKSGGHKEPNGIPSGPPSGIPGGGALKSSTSNLKTKESERGPDSLSFRIPECPKDMDAEREHAACAEYHGEEPSGPEWRSWVLRGVKSGVYAKQATRPPTAAEIMAERRRMVEQMERA